MPVVLTEIQQLRSDDATKLPDALLPGQIAVNTKNHWLMIGDGSADITVDGTALAYGTTVTVLGVASVVIPAKPAAGEGYYIAKVSGSAGIDDLVTTIPGVVGSLPAITGGAGGTAGTYTVTPTTDSTAAGVTPPTLKVVVDAAGAVTSVTVVDGGTKNEAGDVLTIAAAALGAGSAQATFTLGAGNIVIGFAPSIVGAGILVRDPNVADGQPSAWKLVRGLDAGSY